MLRTITESFTLSQNTTLSMVKIPGGSFNMGDHSMNYRHSKPVFLNQVDDFAIGQFPITRAQFTVFLNEYGSIYVLEGDFKGMQMIAPPEGMDYHNNKWRVSPYYATYPMVNITWYGALIFTEWLSQKTGLEFSLPAEAQWEFAARGGNLSKGFPFAGGHKLKEVGWHHYNTLTVRPVGLKLPNELCIYDMSGNVDEWCLDDWSEDYKNIPRDGSAFLDPNKTPHLKVFRGGSAMFAHANCKVSSRYHYNFSAAYQTLGFRVVQNY